jgi:uncharacterized protein YkwD
MPGRGGSRLGTRAQIVFVLATCAALVACAVDNPTTLTGGGDPTDPSAADPSQAAPAPDSGTTSTGASSGASSGAAHDGGASGSSPDSGGTSSGATSSGASGTPSPFDAFQQKNLAVINQYRATKSLQPLALDVKLSTFALAGSKQLAVDHSPHAHFISASNAGTIWQSGFQGSAAENQGDPNGWSTMSSDPTTNEMLQIASIQQAMFNEGPGAGEAHGHYMNMMNPAFTKVGVGLTMVGTSLYLTNDFSQ